MSWRRPRRLLFLCALLDLASVWPAAALADWLRGSSLLEQPLWLLCFGAVYLLLGWLLGSYTVLRWPGLRLPSVLRRLLTTSAVTLLAVILVRWAFNLPVTFRLGQADPDFLYKLALVLAAPAPPVGSLSISHPNSS